MSSAIPFVCAEIIKILSQWKDMKLQTFVTVTAFPNSGALGFYSKQELKQIWLWNHREDCTLVQYTLHGYAITASVLQHPKESLDYAKACREIIQELPLYPRNYFDIISARRSNARCLYLSVCVSKAFHWLKPVFDDDWNRSCSIQLWKRKVSTKKTKESCRPQRNVPSTCCAFDISL